MGHNEVREDDANKAGHDTDRVQRGRRQRRYGGRHHDAERERERINKLDLVTKKIT